MLNTTSPFYLHRRCRWQFAFAACGATAGLACGHLQAQNTASAIVQPGGPRSGVNGTNFFNVEGSSNGANASFGVLDFSAASFNFSNPNVSGVQGGTLSLTLTESNGTFTKAGPLEFYLTTNNTTSIVSGPSPLKFTAANAADPTNSPYGIDPQLGAIPGSTGAAGNSFSLFDLGSATFTPQTASFQSDTYILTLSATAMQAFVSSLKSTAADIRLVIAGSSATTAATFSGATTSFTTERPMLSFTPTFSTANNLDWQGGSSTWTPTGGTTWNTTNTGTGTGTAGWNNDGTHSAVFAEATGSTVPVDTGINAAGLEFDTNGYVLNPTSIGNTLTLSGSGPIIQVTNATDTATVNITLGGTSGFIKTGAGTLVLGAANSYTGTTAINAGTLSISSDANLGNGGAVALNGGTLQTAGSLTSARAFSGSGGLGVTAGNTFTVSGVVNMGALTLPGAGTVLLTNTDFSTLTNANAAFTGVTFQSAGASLQTQNSVTTNGMGVVNLGTGGITAAQSSGTVSAAAIFQVAGTVPISVANAGATLKLSGIISGAAVLAKTGAGTLVINSDNSGLTGLVSTATPPAATTSFRQGTAGANPLNGGVVSIVANSDPTVNVGAALGNAEYQANGGTISNDTGAALVLTISDISLGAQDITATPGGLVFAGANAITVNGPISMFNSGTALYQHAITVNTPTTVTGILSVATPATATKSLGLTLRGSSTLTLNAAARGTMTEPITIATSGPNAGVIALAEGTFAANSGVTINAGASLTIRTGVMSGPTDAINDGALLTINGTAGTPGSFGKLTLDIGTGQETVGGLLLAANDGTFLAGYLPAGTYGSSQSLAQYKDDALFSGTGVLVNLNAVPEPSTWAALGLGGLLGLAAMRRRHRAA